MRGLFRCLAPALAFIAALVAVAPSDAAVRLGPDLTPVPGPGFVAVGCQSAAQYQPCSYVTYSSTNPDLKVAAPTDGVITAWRFRAGCCLEQTDVAHTLTLRTYRPGVQTAGGYAYLVPAGTGPSFVIPPGNQLPSDPPAVLPARLSVQAGEIVGIEADYPTSFAVYNPTANVSSTVLFNTYTYLGESYGNPIGSTAIAINADLEPDADDDGYGDETQDCQPTDPTQHVACTPPPSPPIPNPPSVVDPGGHCTENCGGGIIFSAPIPPQTPSGDGSKIYIPLKCPPTAVQPCGGFLILNQAKPKSGLVLFKTLAKSSYTIAPGESQKVKLKLSKAGRKLLDKRGKLKVELTIDPNEGDSVTKTIKLRRG